MEIKLHRQDVVIGINEKLQSYNQVGIISRTYINGTADIYFENWTGYGCPKKLYTKLKHFKLYDGKEEINMANKLIGFNKVAVVKQGCTDYHFAIYEDGVEYKAGDRVMVSGDTSIKMISSIISVEELMEKYNKNITSEVINKIDTTAYDERVAKRKEAAEIKKKMDEEIKRMDEMLKYEMYAARNPELKELYDKYKEVVNEN